MISSWPVYEARWEFEAQERAVETIKEAVRGIRNVRADMNVPNSKKATVYVVSPNAEIREIFSKGKSVFAALSFASEVLVQTDKTNIDENAVSAVIPEAAIYMPLSELLDVEKEKERLKKEEARLEKELSRVNGMLNNEKFVSKAPASKIEEEKEKLEKYTQMMAQVKERLVQLGV